jgi:sulfopyruvate decarboxylase alpha subunit
MTVLGSIGEFHGPEGFAWAEGDWRRDVFAVLKAAGVRQAAYVPDAGHIALIEACIADPDIEATVLTTEEEGIGVLAGADLGGERGVMLMQSSGVGNCINGFSLLKVCGFPFLTLVTMRGEWGEFNPWQLHMGQRVAAALELAGAIVHRLDDPARAAETVQAAGAIAFHGQMPAAVLIAQSVIGSKTFGR